MPVKAPWVVAVIKSGNVASASIIDIAGRVTVVIPAPAEVTYSGCAG